jgi:hypothetical protein
MHTNGHGLSKRKEHSAADGESFNQKKETESWQGRIMGTDFPPTISVSMILPGHDSAGLRRPLKKALSKDRPPQ